MSAQGRDVNRQAIDWHSRVARDFDARYATDRVFRERFDLWDDAIRRHSGTGRRALDIGCGPGQFLWLLAERNAEAVGVDGSDGMLDICREQLAGRGLANVTLRQADIAQLGELGLGTFDLVIASSVFEYLADLGATLRAVAGMLRPGGRLVFSIPNRASLVRRLHPLSYRLFGRPAYVPLVRNRVTQAELGALLAPAGLAVESARYFAPTAGLSPALRPLGLHRWCENLILVECAPRAPAAVDGNGARA